MDAFCGAGPDAAIAIDAKPVEQARRRLGEDLAARQPAARVDPEPANVARTVLLVRRAGVGDIEIFLVGRKGDAVRSNHIGDDRGDLAGLGVDPIDLAAVDLLRGAISFVVGVDAVGGVGEPDGVVGLHHDVIGRIQPSAVPLFRDDGNRAVDFGSGDAAREMLAGDQPALIVDGVAVRIIGGLAEDRDVARRLDEPHHAIVRNVRPDEIAARGEPGRAFGPTRSRPQALDPHMAGEASLEARIENNDVRSLDLTIPHRIPRRFILPCDADHPGKGDHIPDHPRRVPHGIAIILRFLDLRNRRIRIEGRLGV